MTTNRIPSSSRRRALATIAATVATASLGVAAAGPAMAATTAAKHSFVPPVVLKTSSIYSVGSQHQGIRHIELTPGTKAPHTGQVVVAGIGAKTPSGLLARVTAVHTVHGRPDLTTVPAGLNQALAPGNYKVAEPVTSSAPPSTKALTAPKPFTVTAKCNGPVSVKLSGELPSLSAQLTAQLRVSLAGVKSMSVLLTFSESASLRAEIDAAASCSFGVPILNLNVPFSIGPIGFKANFSLQVDGSAKANGKLVLAGSQNVSGSTGLSYTPADGLRTIGDGLHASSQLQNPGATGTASLDAGLTASIGLNLLDVIKAHLDTRVYAGFTADQTSVTPWSVYAGVKVSAGLWIVLIGDLKPVVLFLEQWPLASGLGFSPPALPDAVSGIPYFQQLSALGGYGQDTFSVIGGALPPGLTLSPDGHLNGLPASVVGSQVFPFTVLVTDAAGDQVQRALTLQVDASAPLWIDGSSPLEAVAGEPLTTQFQAHGGTGALTWTAHGLPAGFTLSSTGRLDGTPSERENGDRFTVVVTDSTGVQASRTVTLDVAVREIICRPSMPHCQP
jgi:Putative Ig domain